MTFLKKHYEKFLLTFFLIIFVIALIWQIGIITTSLQVTPEDLNIPRQRADYVNINFVKEFNTLQQLSKGALWLPSTSRMNSAVFTDLMIPITAARCPYCKHIIPLYDFKVLHRCSICMHPLKKPKIIEIKGEDEDSDGIPDKIEKAHHMNPADPDDIYEDVDEDGFDNISEYRYDKTGEAIDNPKKHPSLALKLSVRKIKRKRVYMKIKKIVKNGPQKSQWEIHMDVRNRRRWRTKFPHIGDTVTIDGVEYKVIDIIPKTVKKYSKTFKRVVNVDVSEVLFQKIENQEIVKATVGQRVYEPKPAIYITDVLSGKRIVTYPGEKFKVGNSKIGIEYFIVEKLVSASKKIVRIKRKDGKLFIIKPIEAEKEMKRHKKQDVRRHFPGNIPNELLQGDIPPELLKEMKSRRRRR